MKNGDAKMISMFVYICSVYSSYFECVSGCWDVKGETNIIHDNLISHLRLLLIENV